jgi:predicted Na+-dependent transporter
MTCAILLGVGIPVCLLFAGSTILFVRARTVYSLLQLIGTVCLLIVVLAHIAEAFHLFRWMDWGMRNSVGHYVDFWSAVLGLTLFPIGYFCHALNSLSKSAK